jgi:transcriptional regulator with XRE-family HTH domain
MHTSGGAQGSRGPFDRRMERQTFQLPVIDGAEPFGIIHGMARRSTERQEADALTRRVRFEMGREIRDARISAGASLRLVAARVGMSHAQLGRIERAAIDALTVDQLSRGCAAVGLRLVVRAAPGVDPAVDSGQLALLERFRRRLPPTVTMATEVPLPLRGDQRAWDGLIRIYGVRIGIEAEARLRDIQGLDRRIALKGRDGGVEIVILLVSDTASNRRMLAMHRESLRSRFSLDTRQILGGLRVGHAPTASGIVVL